MKNKNLLKYIIIPIVSGLLAACMGMNENDPSLLIVPEVNSFEVQDNGSLIFDISAKVDDMQAGRISECGFYYGKNYGFEEADRIVCKLQGGSFSAKLTLDEYGETIYVCAFISSGVGDSEICSETKNIKIKELKDYISFSRPDVITFDKMSAKVQIRYDVVEGLQISESGISYIIGDEELMVQASDNVAQINDIKIGELYKIAAYAKSGEELAYSEYIEFTPHSVPGITTKTVTDIQYTSALSGGINILDNGKQVTQKGLVWSTSPKPTVERSNKLENGYGTGDYKSLMEGLTPGTKYYVRAYAINSDGVGYGDELSFETLSQSTAVVSTTQPTKITSTSAVSGGCVVSDGGAPVTARGVVWSYYQNPTVDLETKSQDGVGSGEYTSDITDLQPGMKYYVRAYVTNTLGTSYGEEFSFTTQPAEPLVATHEASEITKTSAKVGGEVINAGGVYVTERGIVWSTSPAPTIDDSVVNLGSGLGEFYTTLSGLDVATTYYVRAYARNSVGVSYGNEVEFTTGLDKPVVLTTPPNEITSSSAMAGGEVTFDGGAPVIARGVVWSTDPEPMVLLPTKTSNGTGTGLFVSSIIGLEAGTSYYLRAYATNSVGTSYGEALEFKTKVIVPTVTTDEIGNISTTSALVGGDVTATGGDDVYEKGVVWSTTPNPTTNSNKIIIGSGLGHFSTTLTGLSVATTYYVRAYAVNSAGISYGGEKKFTTGSVKPTVVTALPTDITSYSADTGGNVTFDGGAPVTARGVVWSESPNPTIALSTKTKDGSGSGSFVSHINGLEPGTTYYIRAYATNVNGTSYGDEMYFATMAVKPTVATSKVTNVTATSAVVGGNVTATGGADVYERGVVWSTSPKPSVSNNKIEIGKGTGYFTTEMTNLSVATTYYVRAYAINSVGITYGEEEKFTTGSVKPTVLTTSPKDITSYSAVSGGNVTFDGGMVVTARGVVWSESPNPTISLSTKTRDGVGNGEFVSNIWGLAPGIVYYLRAYATNSIGTSYGEEVMFTTDYALPSVEMRGIYYISSRSAQVGGAVTSTGGLEISAYGIVWSTSPNPTVELSSKTEETTMYHADFTATMTDLMPNTTYYLRAYATNSKGTAYGKEVAFVTKSEGANEDIGNEDFDWE